MVQHIDQSRVTSEIVYPESDGKPLADNTIQFHAVQKAEQESRRAEQESQLRRNAIPRLLTLGLSAEQVATVLDFPVEVVNQSLR